MGDILSTDYHNFKILGIGKLSEKQKERRENKLEKKENKLERQAKKAGLISSPKISETDIDVVEETKEDVTSNSNIGSSTPESSSTKYLIYGVIGVVALITIIVIYKKTR